MIILDYALEPPVTSYSNPGGTGDRTASITVTSNNAPNAGTLNNAVDGSTAVTVSGSVRWSTGWPGLILTFQFTSKVYIDEIRASFANTPGPGGTWKWQASNDGISFVDCGSAFTLNGTVDGLMNAFSNLTPPDTAGYTYYRINNIGNDAGTSQTWVVEIEFKIAPGVT
jgi:hypothetical protein